MASICWRFSWHHLIKPIYFNCNIKNEQRLDISSRPTNHDLHYAWWRHQMETFSALLAICAGNSSVTSHKGQWHGALMFPLICAWINALVNNRDAGDLRRHRAHYDVTAMVPWGSFIYMYISYEFWADLFTLSWNVSRIKFMRIAKNFEWYSSDVYRTFYKHEVHGKFAFCI